MRIVFKSKEGKLFRLSDPEAVVCLDEWTRSMKLFERIIEIAVKEKVSLPELILCVSDQLQ